MYTKAATVLRYLSYHNICFYYLAFTNGEVYMCVRSHHMGRLIYMCGNLVFFFFRRGNSEFFWFYFLLHALLAY